MNRVRLIAVIAGVTAISMLGMACGDSVDETSTVTKSAGADTFDWGVITVKAPRTLVVGGGLDYCVGDPRPRIARPQVEYQGDDVYVSLDAERPPKRASKGKACAGKELLVTRAITLRQDLSDIEVYNADTEPPEVVWPL